MADSDLAELRNQCVTSLYLCTENVSKYLDSEKEAEFKKLKSYVEDYCRMEAQQAVAMYALEKTKRETEQTNLDSLEDRFHVNLASMANSRLNVNNSPITKEFNKRMRMGMVEARQNLDESDLAITETQNQYIDPITKKQIVDPVRNRQCGHIYERAAIDNLLRNRGRVKCPVAGCGNHSHIEQRDLVVDDELRFRMTLTQHSTMIQDRSVTNLDNSQDE